MSTQQAVRAPLRAPADARERAQSIERALARFRPEVQTSVRALAARHPWIADLAVSFPALLFALAFPRVRDDSVVFMVIGGAPLARIAMTLGVPMWMRAFPPQAFDATPLPLLPDTTEFRRRIANHLPRRWADAPAWIAHVANAWHWGDEEMALWFAREAPLKLRRPRWARRRPDVAWRLIVLWAWFSQRPETQAHSLIVTRWNADMQWAAAVHAAAVWRDSITAPLYLSTAGVDDVWLTPAIVDGYAFEPVRSAADLTAEAVAMNHCVGAYAADIADNYYRVWSVRKNGERVATLSLMRAQIDAPFANIHELAGPQNAAVDVEVWRAARRWLAAHDDTPLGERLAYSYRVGRMDAALWRKLWRPYWLAKRAIPAWLPLTPVYDAWVKL